MAETQTSGQLKYISPEQIEKNEDNPRLVFRQSEMESLLASIDQHGIQVPLAVYREGSIYRLIDGERRWRCALKLNLKTVPALVQQKPSPLDNLLLMYNIHALREQWDYYTIASKLTRVIELFVEERGWHPNEVELSEATGLTRRQIRRCYLIINLPDKFKKLLLKELELPLSQQKLSEDFFIEMERSLRTITGRMPEYADQLDEIRGTLIEKFRRGAIPAITDFRQLTKIATAVTSLGITPRKVKRSLDRVFNNEDQVGIREIYRTAVELEYDEQKAWRQVEFLTEFLDRISTDDQVSALDNEFLALLKKLRTQIGKLLKGQL